MAMLGAVFGGICSLLAWQDWRVYSTGTPNPVDIRLADLTTNGAGGNLHVHVTDLQFGNAYVVEKKNGAWNRVWVPVATPGGQVRAVVKTFSISDEGQLRGLCSRPDVTGIVTNDLHSLGSEETAKLANNYPGVDFASLPIVEQGRVFPSIERVRVVIGGAVGLWGVAAVTGLLALVFNRREKRQAEMGEAITAPTAAPAPPGGEGLGELRRTFPAGGLGKSALGGGIFFLLLFGGFAAFALANTKPQELYQGYIVMGSLGLLFVLMILGGIAHIQDSAALYADGVVCKRRWKTMACRWDEVQSIQGMLPIPTRFQPMYLGGPMTLRRADGQSLTVGDIANAGELFDAVYQEVLRRRVPQALQAMRNGETVPIGRLRLDRTGISGRWGQPLAWEELERLEVERSKIIIRQKGSRRAWTTLSLATPNAGLLLDLTQAVRRGELR
jgi:hypothetical protein